MKTPTGTTSAVASSEFRHRICQMACTLC